MSPVRCRTWSRAFLGGTLALGLLASCTGEVGPTDLEVGPAPLRRLSRFEYENAVRDLLGELGDPGIALPPDGNELGFDNFASAQSVGRADVEKYQLAAEVLARVAVDRAHDLARCAPDDDESACGRAFVDRFLTRAYRRPPTRGEAARVLRLFDEVRASDGFAEGVGVVVEVALQAPQFLYRPERGNGDTVGNVVPLTSHELATRLSFLLWGSIPDERLLAAASRGDLDDADGVEREAKRMLRDRRARTQIRHFHAQWLGLDGLTSLTKSFAAFPAYNGELRAAWREETLAFAEHVVFEGAGTLGELLTAPYTLASRDLATFYGVAGPEGKTFEVVPLDPARRSGLLTQASLLAIAAHADRTSPVLRGKLVRERFLCQIVPPPPPGAATFAPVELAGTARDRAARHRTDPACASCHDLLDPVGLAFEHYDGIGQWRDDDGGNAIDATVTVTGVADGTPLADAVALAHGLAASDAVADCVATQWFRYASGRIERETDATALRNLREGFRRSGGNVKRLLVDLVRSDAFRHRPAGG